MKWALIIAAALMAACSHSEGRPHAGEDVPRSASVQREAIPRDMPPATPPIPPTSRSGEAPKPASSTKRGEQVNPPPPGQPQQQVPNPPPPNPIP